MSGLPRVLVLGATGMLGHKVTRGLGTHLEVHASVRDPARAEPLHLPATLHPFSVGAPEQLQRLLHDTRPDVVVNCIGLVKQREEAERPLPAITVNALFPHQLADLCVRRGTRLIHLSTDCVFSGRLPAPERYHEDHLADPVDLYGRSKLVGEPAGDGVVTIRTSMIGWEFSRVTGLLEWFASQTGAEVRGFTQAVFSGLTTAALAEVIGMLVRDFPGMSGLYHVAAEPISKYDLLTRLNEVLAIGCTIVPVSEPRINRALDPSRFARETGLEPPLWKDMLEDYREAERELET